jgi:hypothetical protein
MVEKNLRGIKLKKLPFWFPNRKNAIWYILFILLFLLSLDFWGWNQSKPLILGLPIWMYYLLILTLLTSLAFYLFTKLYWRDDNRK